MIKQYYKQSIFFFFLIFGGFVQAAQIPPIEIPSWVKHLQDNGFKAVIFDMDDTIINTQKVLKYAVIDVISSLLKRSLNEREKIHAEKYSVFTLGSINLYLRVNYHVIESNKVIEEQMALSLKSSVTEKIQYIDGFEAFIHLLNKYGFRVALATNAGMGFVASVNDKLSLKDYFYSHLYTCKTVGVLLKPDPGIFLYSAEQLGVAPAECLVIGDSLEDAQAANAALMPSICIEHDENVHIRNLFTITIANYAAIELALLKIQQRAILVGNALPGMRIAKIL